MAAHVRRHGGGNLVLGLVVGALLVALLGLVWMAWSGGLVATPDPANAALDLEIPTPRTLPAPTPMPDPQPTPLPVPGPQPR